MDYERNTSDLFGMVSENPDTGALRPNAADRGVIRDILVDHLSVARQGATIAEMEAVVRAKVGPDIGSSSVRSYLNLNTPGLFERVARGKYRLAGVPVLQPVASWPEKTIGNATIHNLDCFDWLRQAEESSVEAVLTDPPYGLVEYTEVEKQKLRAGKGGVWRLPPSFDGCTRSPLPRFTTLTPADLVNMHRFFRELGTLLARVVVPGGNVVVASNPLLAHIVASAMAEGGLEMRGTITRLVMTMRGGDRPKNAHEEFSGVSVMPRSQHEPWVMLRKPLDGRVQDNLRRWGTGGFRRISDDRPFGDVIRSAPTSAAEKRLAPHPSLKPQDFLRQLARGCLPLGTGRILDPFAGSGSTLAACNAIGYKSVGIEADSEYFKLACTSIPRLTALEIKPRD
jgi:site-specific DNA-methyltransferase (adenine-specific)